MSGGRGHLGAVISKRPQSPGCADRSGERAPGCGRGHAQRSRRPGPAPVQPRHCAAGTGRPHRRHGPLQEAVDAHLDAVNAAPTGHPGRAGYLSNLGNALLALAERTGDAQTLEDGVDMCGSARAARAGHPEHAANLSKLNGALLVQARRTYDDSARTSLLDQAVQVGQDAVAATPQGNPTGPCTWTTSVPRCRP